MQVYTSIGIKIMNLILFILLCFANLKLYLLFLKYFWTKFYPIVSKYQLVSKISLISYIMQGLYGSWIFKTNKFFGTGIFLKKVSC